MVHGGSPLDDARKVPQDVDGGGQPQQPENRIIPGDPVPRAFSSHRIQEKDQRQHDAQVEGAMGMGIKQGEGGCIQLVKG